MMESNSLPSATAGAAQHWVGYVTYQLSIVRKLSLDWYKKKQNELTEDQCGFKGSSKHYAVPLREISHSVYQLQRPKLHPQLQLNLA